MPDVNYPWVREQLTAARARQGSGDAVIKLLKTWEGVEIPEELIPEVVELFTQLIQGHATKEKTEELWVQAYPGGPVRVGATVRVLSDWKTGKLGEMHNGRQGKVVAIRSGDVIVKIDDGKKPEFSVPVHYPFIALEFRARG